MIYRSSGCPEGWIEGVHEDCFYFSPDSTTGMDYIESKRFCYNLRKSSLAEIPDEETFNLLKTEALKYKNQWWLGASNVGHVSIFMKSKYIFKDSFDFHRNLIFGLCQLRMFCHLFGLQVNLTILNG